MRARTVDESVAQELVERARTEGVELVGPGGLLTGLTKTVLETALEAELDEHLGYPKHAVEGRNTGNSRNGTRSKTVLTEVGEVELDVPRDREGSFEPKIVRKRQRRMSGVDELVISLAAKGLTTGEIAAHFADVYGAEVSKDTISRVTEAVMEELQTWQSRPLDSVEPARFSVYRWVVRHCQGCGLRSGCAGLPLLASSCNSFAMSLSLAGSRAR